MKFKIFTLHPDIFSSFVANSLIARAISKQIIEIKTIDWRQDFGIGKYKQVDDKPFGGGSGMVLMADPIVNCMIAEKCFDNSILNNGKINVSCISDKVVEGDRYCGDKMVAVTKSYNNQNTTTSQLDLRLPNNHKFYEQIYSGKFQTQKVNILMTPRGYPMTQQTVEWLAKDFEEINILCGRYEGFDTRINDHIDLELSIGSFVLNGGEVASMCLVEAVSRLVPDFITKNTSVLHDSFSSGLNNYNEFEFENSKPQYQKTLEKSKNNNSSISTCEPKKFSLLNGIKGADEVVSLIDNPAPRGNSKTVYAAISQSYKKQSYRNLFDKNNWLQNILPYIEHPQYTRPNIWQDPITNQQKKVPEVLLSGDHAKIQKWRVRWW